MTHDPARVLPLDRNDYNRARSYAPELLTHADVRILPVPPRETEAQDPLYRRLDRRLRPGVLLTRNIWQRGDYVEATTAYEELSLQKFVLFAAVCQRLGAIRLDVREVETSAEEGRQAARAKLSLMAGKGSGSFSNETAATVARRLQAHWVWPGSSPDQKAAVALVYDSGLAADHVVKGLVDQRSYPANLLNEHHLELDVSFEARREVRAALEIQSLARKLGPSFEADLTILKKQTSSLKLNLTVSFG